MKITRTWLTWLIACAWWLYFLAGMYLYGVLRVAWVNTFDLLFGFAVLLVTSIWYVTDRLRHSKGQAGKGDWVIGPWGIHRRRDSEKYQSQNLPEHQGKFSHQNPE
jgi:hypothetical protein